MREILEMLAIKVTATPKHIDIQGVIPLEFTFMQSSDNVRAHFWVIPLAIFFKIVRIAMRARCTSTGSWAKTPAT
jgi:hypothetical protein